MRTVHKCRLLRRNRANGHLSCTELGFSLVEVLVALAVLAIVSVILLSSIQRMRVHATTTKCATHQRQLAMGILLFAGEHEGRIPPGWNGYHRYVWQYDVAPYLGVAQDNSHGEAGTIWQCPSIDAEMIENRAGAASYAINEYLLYLESHDPVVPNRPEASLYSIAYPSTTPLLADNAANNTDKLSPPIYRGGQGTLIFRHPTADPVNPASTRNGALYYRGTGKVNIAFCDGHVECLEPAEVVLGGDNNLTWNPQN